MFLSSPSPLQYSRIREWIPSRSFACAAAGSASRGSPLFRNVLIAMLAGSLRVSTPFLFVSIGECLTEKSGRINLGNEGVLVLGAMVAYATSYETGDPWMGVVAAAVAGPC